MKFAIDQIFNIEIAVSFKHIFFTRTPETMDGPILQQSTKQDNKEFQETSLEQEGNTGGNKNKV